MAATRKRKADEDGDEMNLSPLSSPAIPPRPLTRPSKKVRQTEAPNPQRTLPLPRLLETLDNNQLRTVLQRICERHQDIQDEVVNGAPRPSVASAIQVLGGYLEKLRAAMPYGHTSSDYTYFRVKQPLAALADAILDFTPQYLPPIENQASVSLQFLDGATKLAHSFPDWDSQAYRHHKDNVYDGLSTAWALVINKAAKQGGGFTLHTNGWDQILAKHNQESGGRLQQAMNAMATNVGWADSNQAGPSNSTSDPNSLLNQLMSGTYGSPVRVGPW